MRLDGVGLGGGGGDEAAGGFAVVVGGRPAARLGGRGWECAGGVRRFQLARGAVELAPGPPGLQALRFVVDAMPAAALPDAVHGIPVHVEPAAAAAADADGESRVTPAIDHVVVQS